MYEEGTIAAIATPAGTGGIAVIRLSGPQAFAVASRVFTPKNPGKSLKDAPGYTALFGSLSSPAGQAVDEGIALCFRAPHSYTGEDVIELSCHGGQALSRAVLLACLAAGARPAMPGEFTQRAVLNGRLSLTQAEAVMELIAANSPKGLGAAHAAYTGALHRKAEALAARLVELAGHLAAWTDYPEEGVESLETERFLQVTAEVREALDALIANYSRGHAALRGVRTAIVGSPNVGKSTLFNLLSGFERAIVTPVAGTTRDVVSHLIEVGGVALHLADTAGLHESGDVVEQEGMRRSVAEMDAAQLIIAVFDGSTPPDEAQLSFAKSCQGRAALAVVNKSDLGLRMTPAALAPYFTEVVVASAIDPASLKDLENAILRILNLDKFDPNAALLTSERQLSAAVSARAALADAQAALAGGLALDAAGVCLDDAIRALYALSGRDATEAVIDEVFSKFCVGK